MEQYDCIVSLTTWKGRINNDTLCHVLFNLIEKQVTDFKYKVVLVLSEEEFGKDYKLPKKLNLITKSAKFEILWTYKNTKALKKLDPVMEKYPDLPIITLDDDELLDYNAIDMMMKEHQVTPDMILGTICGACNGIMRVGELRLYPPHSLYKLDDNDFEKYFNCLQDDEWNGIRAKIKNTQMRRIKRKLVIKQTYGNQGLALRKEYVKFDCNYAIRRFKEDHPQYRL